MTDLEGGKMRRTEKLAWELGEVLLWAAQWAILVGGTYLIYRAI